MSFSMYETIPSTTSINVVWDSSLIRESSLNGDISLNREMDYVIKYRVCGTRGEFFDLKKKISDVEIDGLKSNTQYDINVYCVDDEGDNHTLFKTTCTTKASTVSVLMENCTADKTGCPTVYHFRPLHEDKICVTIDKGTVSNDESGDKTVESDYISVYDMIAEYKPSITTYEEKTLLLLGATGTGKSTMIESLVNYLADVSYSENHRFSIICKSDEERRRTHLPHVSQTTSVTLYRVPKIESFKVNYKVNIIDTPGFLDTRNNTESNATIYNFDKRIEMQIKHLLETRVDHLDAILVVVPMAETRLTDAQKRLFKSIVCLFGNDMKDNIFIAMTKDDGGQPACLPVIDASGLPYAEYFRFNNSNVYTKENPQIDAFIWSKRKNNFSKLFAQIEKVPKRSVKSSVEVMNARLTLQVQLEALKNKLSELTQNVAIGTINLDSIDELTKNATLMDKFKYVVSVPVYIKRYTRKTSMNCTYCHQTCHENCWVPLNIFNRTCEAMKGNECLVCDKRCDVSKHIREKYIYKLTFEDKTFTSKSALEEFIKQKRESFAQFQSIIEKIGTLIEELKVKALQPDVLSTEAYIEELITREQVDRHADSTLRINVLEKVIRHLKKKESIWKLKIDVLIN